MAQGCSLIDITKTQVFLVRQIGYFSSNLDNILLGRGIIAIVSIRRHHRFLRQSIPPPILIPQRHGQRPNAGNRNAETDDDR